MGAQQQVQQPSIPQGQAQNGKWFLSRQTRIVVALVITFAIIILVILSTIGIIAASVAAIISTTAGVLGALFASWPLIFTSKSDPSIATSSFRATSSRFREAVLDLGKDETKLGGATTLRTFLQKEEGRGYERFYQQIFDLSVEFLRLRKVDQNNPEPDPFYKEIIRVFCESAPLVREMRHLQTLSQLDVPNFENYQRKFFNASHIHLENADLVLVDLRLADLISANFSGANLISANFSGADLSRADLSEADLTRANPEEASFLVGTRMWDVKNYPDLEKRQKCIGKGADFNTPTPAPRYQR